MKIITIFGFPGSQAENYGSDSLSGTGSEQRNQTNSDQDRETILDRNIESGSLMDVKNFASLKIFRSKSILNR